MKDRCSLKPGQLAYIIPATLYTLWQACAGWLNTYWTLENLGHGFTMLNYVLFFSAHAVGTVLFAFRLDRPVSARRQKEAALLSALAVGLLTASMAFANGLWLISAGVLAGLAAGFFSAFLLFYLLSDVPAEEQGAALGISAAAGLAVHYLVFSLLFPQTVPPVLYGKTFFAAAVFPLLGLLALWLPLCRDRLWSRNRPPAPEPKENLPFPPRLLPILGLILFLFYMAYGMQDFAATAYWMQGSGFLVHTRLFLMAGFITGGLLWNRQQRHLLLSSSFGMLALGFVAMAYEYTGAASFLGFAGVQFASAFFSVSILLLFLDAARFYKRPVFVASLGLAAPLILKQAGILSAGLIYAQLGGTAIFIGSLIFIALGFSFVPLLFDRIRDMHELNIRVHAAPLAEPMEGLEPTDHSGQEPDSGPDLENLTESEDALVGLMFDEAVLTLLLQKHRFTRREAQVLELSLHGLSKPQIAQDMNISEATVKYHIRNILAKTDMKNLKQLIFSTVQENELLCSIRAKAFDS